MGHNRNSGKGKSISQYDVLEGRESANRLIALPQKIPLSATPNSAWNCGR
jgi:hypothetical protein